MTELEERRVRIGDLLRHLLIDVEGLRRLTDEPPEGDILKVSRDRLSAAGCLKRADTKLREVTKLTERASKLLGGTPETMPASPAAGT